MILALFALFFSGWLGALLVGALRTTTKPVSGRGCADKTYVETLREYSQKGKATKTALVTGGAGFIGSHVADYCKTKLGFNVVVVDDLSGGFMRNVPQGVHFERGDMGNVSFIQGVWRQHGPFDYVYHIGAYAAEGLSHFIRRYNYMNNLVASVSLLNEALKQ